ncbi:MAG: hypothetical protein QM803_04485 [Rhodocyclaceae bacterium]
MLHLQGVRDAALNRLADAQKRQATLKRQAGDPASQAAQRMRLATLSRQIDDTIWQFPSPTIGQAAFSEWVTTQMRAAGVNDARISQPTFRHLGGDGGNGTASATIGKERACTGDGACDLVELRSSVRFAFNAGGLTKALASIEGANYLSAVEQLNASAREGRVNMTVVTLARIVPVVDGDRTSATPTSSVVAEGTTASPPPAPAPKKIIQVRW